MPSPLDRPVKFHIRTLGCKMNWLDSARLSAALSSAGHLPVTDEADADYVLVNSCTVTAQADRKSRQQANAARRAQKQVAVLGCGPRVDADAYRRQLGDTLVFGSEAEMLDYFGVEEESDPLPLNTRTRLPVAIQTGCDDLCSFCITRIARGRHRNLPLESILRQIRQAEELGLKEIVLTGINLAAWGCENTRRPEESRLHELLAEILARSDIPRIRLSSLGPQYLHDGFFELFADPRICDHLHLSVQSGCDATLRRMQRGHGVEELFSVAERARRARPDVGLAADLIVGFPGETEEEFETTLDAVRSLGFSRLHVFPFSPREGTPAAGMSPTVAPEVKKARAARLRELGSRLRDAFIASQLGREREVLVESNETGLTGNYLRISTPGIRENAIHTVRITADRVLRGG
ncbi:MAG: tRNA (N(6)-L-threonylcarbamoyladenosine(37)-C(2))-methylthiotransferase MtaB [Gammaproteobacteria bacterium]